YDDNGDYAYDEHLNVYESIKLDKAEQLLREVTEEGERAVLFSQFNPGLHILNERLGSRSIVYDGKASKATKNQVQLDFDATISNPEPKWEVLLGIYKYGGEGLNFKGAFQEILIDREWSPVSEDQAVGRMEGMGESSDRQPHD